MKTKPHAKVHCSIRNHPRFAGVFADPRLRGIIVGVFVIAAERHASKTGDVVSLTSGDLLWITGAPNAGSGSLALSRAVAAMGWRAHREQTAGGTVWHIELRNFSRKQGFGAGPSGGNAALTASFRPPPIPNANANAESGDEEDAVGRNGVAPATPEPDVVGVVAGSGAPHLGGTGTGNGKQPSLDPELRDQLFATAYLQPLAEPEHAALWHALERAYDPHPGIFFEREIAKADTFLASARPEDRPAPDDLPRFIRNWFSKAVEIADREAERRTARSR